MTQELIAKLESASEGSRELDYLVEAYLNAVVGAPAQCPRYTTSIDAALALAERVLGDGWAMNVCKDAGPDVGPAFRWSSQIARGQLGGSVGRRDMFIAVSDTPAPAICAALLRASAAEGSGQ